MVIAGLAGKINQMAQSYFAVMLTLITIMVLSLVLGTWLLFVGTITPFVGLGFALALFAYVVAAALHGALLKSCLFFVQYLVSVPVPLVMFPIYSFWFVHAPACCQRVVAQHIPHQMLRGRWGCNHTFSSHSLVPVHPPSSVRLNAHAPLLPDPLQQPARHLLGHQGGQPAERNPPHARGQG
jgi:hypothetical protein